MYSVTLPELLVQCDNCGKEAEGVSQHCQLEIFVSEVEVNVWCVGLQECSATLLGVGLTQVLGIWSNKKGDFQCFHKDYYKGGIFSIFRDDYKDGPWPLNQVRRKMIIWQNEDSDEIVAIRN
jgi:hypothetical protein